MKTGGFPCRLLGCPSVFQVVDQKSMDALMAASALRTEHEVSTHGYHHVQLSSGPSFMSYARSRARPPAAK